MGARVLQCFTLFLLCLFPNSGSSVEEKPPLEEIKQNRKLDRQENQLFFSSSKFTTQLDGTTPTTIPIINPTTPTTTTPIVNPTETPPSPPTTPTTTPPTIPTTTPPTTPTTTPPTTPTTTSPASPSGSAWCAASQSASETALQVAIDYACGYGGADCSAIQPSGSCYNPNTLRDHASYAFNQYYQKNPVPTSCVFGGTAQLTYTDPSSGNCHYASPTTSPSTSSPATPTSPIGVTPITNPGVTPITNPGGPTVYGSEPTGTPSSAASVSRSLLLLFTATCLMMSLLAANYF